MVERYEDLYALPIEEFTPARNALADRLKAEGNKDEASVVRALKKPSVAAWTINQLARTQPDDIEELFRMRDAIESASSAVELRSRAEERRRLLTRLVNDARRLLTQGGHAPAASTIEKVSGSLLAADDDTRDQVVTGTLTRELTPTTSSFGAFGSFDAMSVEFDDEPDEPDPHAERLRAEAEEAETVAAELEAAADAAEEAAEAVRDRAADARRKATKARERAAKSD
ncbi:MAG: hypothetical protein QOG04_729 [Actinomycetota bacterium]|jgi:hypothetical protein|nr:hypothetical protein [Actinomycetota bacterium]